jgi:hypothetical protein
MIRILRKLHDLARRLNRLEPLPRRDAADMDWLPPAIGARDLSSAYFLAMADPGAGWYIDCHRRYRH